MSLQKCANDMAAHTDGWNLKECSVGSCEPWLKDCLGANFELDKYRLESDQPSTNRPGENSYRMSLAQRCEYAWSLSESPKIDVQLGSNTDLGNGPFTFVENVQSYLKGVAYSSTQTTRAGYEN